MSSSVADERTGSGLGFDSENGTLRIGGSWTSVFSRRYLCL